MRTKPESTEANLHLGRGCGLSPNPPEQTRILGADAADPGVVSCARSVTHRRMRSLPCSSPPSARLAPHPELRRPTGRSGLAGPEREGDQEDHDAEPQGAHAS